jgi:F-type H+-transporting ATPase subunit b
MHILSLSEGIGFNTDVLDTNVLNLAVVLFLVVNNLGATFSDVLDKRRDRIVSNMERVEAKFQSAMAAREVAKKRLIGAEKRAKAIGFSSQIAVELASKTMREKGARNLANLEDARKAALAVVEQNASNSIRARMVTRALAQAKTTLEVRLAHLPSRRLNDIRQVKLFLESSVSL